MPWEGRGTRVITPEACITVCPAVLEVIPDKAERTRRGTSSQVAGGFEEDGSRGHPTPAPPQNHGSRAGSSIHILPADYLRDWIINSLALGLHRSSDMGGLSSAADDNTGFLGRLMRGGPEEW